MNKKKDSKTKNSLRNIFFGIILKLYQIIMPFIIRTIIIKKLGMEYAGLNSLFTSLIQVLNIAELGVGTALVFSMYQPIKENNNTKICALMKLYQKYYRIIGLIILIIGIIITPFVPKLITGTVPNGINLYTLYYLNLMATVLSYWLFAYKNSLFQANQRNDIISKITIFTNTVMYLLQIFILYKFKNYYIYVVIIVVSQILNNIIISLFANRYYPDYIPFGNLKKEEVKKINLSIRDLFYGQFGLVITTSVDSIVISVFLGLVPLAIYQNYYYVITALIGFFTIFYQSCRASIGTNLISKTEEENYSDYKFITFCIMCVLTICISCLINLYQPFIKLWVGEENMLDIYSVYLFSLYFFVYELTLLIGSYKDISGKWHFDRFRPLITAIVNLVLNIIMVNIIGIYGILLSTIISFVFINIPWLYKRVFIDIFDKNKKNDYTKYLSYKIIVLLIIVFLNVIICNFMTFSNEILNIVVYLIFSVLTSIILYVLFNLKDENFIRLNNMILIKIKKGEKANVYKNKK